MDDILDTSPDITPEYVESFVSNIAYPITLDNIIKEAYRQRAPDTVTSVLENLQPGIYDGFNELDYTLRKAIY